MKRYFKNLWLAILNKKTPSGLKPNTWYQAHECNRPENGRFSIVTDKYGHVIPFCKSRQIIHF